MGLNDLREVMISLSLISVSIVLDMMSLRIGPNSVED